MAAGDKKHMPQTKDEAEAYFRAMDAANDAVVKGAKKPGKGRKTGTTRKAKG